MPPRKRAKKVVVAAVYPMAGMYTVQVDQCVSDIAEIFQVQPQDIIDHATNYPNTRIVLRLASEGGPTCELMGCPQTGRRLVSGTGRDSTGCRLSRWRATGCSQLASGI